MNIHINSKQNTESDIAVIYQAYGRQGWEGFDKIFFDSYKTHSAGTNHKLFVAATCYENNQEGYKRLKEYAVENKADITPLPDDSMEFGAFYRIAKSISSEYIFCMVASCFILKNNWLKFFTDTAYKDRSYKLLGASGSCENIFPNIFTKFKKLIPLYKKLQMPNDSRHLNPHIRTSCFFIDRLAYINWLERAGLPKSKRESFILESGKKSLTKFIGSKGFNFAVVGADGKCYQTKDWDKSKTFRQPDLSNLIIADKHYNYYLNADTNTRIYLEKLSWGHSIT